MTLDDAALLRLELELLWGADPRGRSLGPHEFVVGTAAGGMVSIVGAGVTDPLAGELSGLVEDAAPAGHPGTRPEVLERCAEVLRRGGSGPIVMSSGPSYLVPTDAGRAAVSAADPAGDATVVRSDSADAAALLAARPEVWRPDEWAELIGGGAGAPWAMVVESRRVIAICHTPRLSGQGAEAGTWTDPDHRGRGLASAVTAAWADLLAPRELALFYSTSADNRSSQRVAERLGLELLGWTWKLTRSDRAGR